MPYTSFPLYQSHLDLAHNYWTRLVSKGDVVVDATCGNGYDTAELVALALTATSGFVHGLDIQQQALAHTHARLAARFDAEIMQRIRLYPQSHASFPVEIEKSSVKLIVYNLGYLPGGDKDLTTTTSSTLQSLEAAQELICAGGAISLTCYPGHTEGEKEQQAVLAAISQWSPKHWSCTLHQWINRRKAPALLFIQKQ